MRQSKSIAEYSPKPKPRCKSKLSFYKKQQTQTCLEDKAVKMIDWLQLHDSKSMLTQANRSALRRWKTLASHSESK